MKLKFKGILCEKLLIRYGSILYGYPCEMDFSDYKISESHSSHLRQNCDFRDDWWDSESSGEKSISHGKPHKMHFLTFFTR